MTFADLKLRKYEFATYFVSPGNNNSTYGSLCLAFVSPVVTLFLEVTIYVSQATHPFLGICWHSGLFIRSRFSP